MWKQQKNCWLRNENIVSSFNLLFKNIDFSSSSLYKKQEQSQKEQRNNSEIYTNVKDTKVIKTALYKD